MPQTLRNRFLFLGLFWLVVVGCGTVMFLSEAYDLGVPGVTVDLAMAENHAAYMQRPGPWNGNRAWTPREAQKWLDPQTRLFWSEVEAAAFSYVAGALVTLIGGVGLITVSYRRQHHPRDAAGEAR